MFIGGLDSLYRIKEYTGEWIEGEREGIGEVTYTNNDILRGYFVHGQAHGDMIFISGATGQPFATVYNNGNRTEWKGVYSNKNRLDDIVLSLPKTLSVLSKTTKE